MNRRLIEKAELLLSKEQGTVYKEHGGKITIALVYPNTYYVGMSNLGFQGIYGILNRMDDVVCERSFLPESEDIEEYLRTNTELFTLETKKPIGRFDIVAFSVSFENDYPNILKILQLSKLPLRSAERNSRHPLIVMGGACALFNPEMVADFLDICFIGEAEEVLPEFLDVFRSSKDRSELLRRTLSVEGLYIPGFYRISYGRDGKISGRQGYGGAPEVIKRRYLKDLSKSDIRTAITTPETEFSDMYLIEVMRGCPWSCRFCVACPIYSPLRKKELKVLEDEIRLSIKNNKRVGLIGPSLSDYPDIKEVLKIPGVDFSITSLRAHAKSAEVVSLLKDHKSISIAPEAGTERLRRIINKRITEEDVLQASERILSEGVQTLRLYFMVGLPTETREDIAGIINLVMKIRDVSPKGRITLSISTFVPKPFTPFQWHPMEDPSEVKERLRMVKKGLLPIKGVKVFHDVPKYAYMQGYFSRGDRRVSKTLEEMLKIKDWRRAAEVAGVREDFYILGERVFDEILPWDFIDSGIQKDRLWAEYREALSNS